MGSDELLGRVELQLCHQCGIVGDFAGFHATANQNRIGLAGVGQVDVRLDGQAVHGRDFGRGAGDAHLPLRVAQQGNPAQHAVGDEGVELVEPVKSQDGDVHG